MDEEEEKRGDKTRERRRTGKGRTEDRNVEGHEKGD